MDIRIKLTAVSVILLNILLAGSATSASGQDYVSTPVQISKEKIRINGQVCYSHVVLEKQTLFSISKAYNVSLEDIYKYNPTIKESGLIKNSILIIPALSSGSTETAVKKEEKEKKTHTVKWYENLDDIAYRYGVTAEEIMLANDLKGKKLKSRMKLVIPEAGEYSPATAEDEAVAEISATDVEPVQEKEESAEEDSIIVQPVLLKEKVNIAVMLPLKAEGVSPSRSNMDFYSGMLLAADDLGTSGIDIDMSVYDIADGKLDTALESLEADKIIIGPVSVKDLSRTAAVAEGMVISPLDPKADMLASSYTNIIQAPTPHRIQYDDLTSWMKEDMNEADVAIVITEKGARQTEAVKEMKNSADSSGLAYRQFSYSILEGRDVLEPLAGLMTLEGTNRVLIASESEAFVNDVVRNLNLMIHQKYNVVLYGPSKIRSFETIEAENFHKTNLHVSLTYYIDYNDSKVKNFLLKYRALFGTEPSQFAFQGYDIASYFIELRSKYGKDWTNMLSQEEKSMLQSTFRFMKAADAGFMNHGVRRIIYEKDWTITKVR